MQIAEAHFDKRRQFGLNLRDIFEEAQGVLHWCIQEICDGVSLVLHLQCLVIISAAAANIASDIDIGQEVHLDPLQTVALTSLATPAFDVEAETARLVSAFPRLRQTGV